MLRPLSTAAALSLSLAAMAEAGTIPGGFTSLTVYGDSFSDTGNTRDAILAATGGLFTYPSSSGRYTAGRNYVDFLAEDWDLSPGVDLFNFAFGGARSVGDPADAILDFGEQVVLSQPTAPLRGSNPLGVVFFGGNDIVQATYGAGGSAALGLNGIAGDETNPTAVAAAEGFAIEGGIAAANAILTTLAAVGPGPIDTYLLFTLPDVGLAPRFALPNALGTNPDTGGSTGVYASLATDAFNDQLEIVADLLRDLGFTIFEVDLAARYDDILDDPAAFGLANSTGACGELAGLDPIFGSLPIYDFSDDTCDEDDVPSIDVPFWDALHPNELIHEEVASLAQRAVVAPVPLPATLPLLAGALIVLGLRRRRR